MYEIEMKAHVQNRRNVVEKLDSFAKYQCSIEKKDSYYRIPVSGKNGLFKSVRIRSEKATQKGGNPTGEKILEFQKASKGNNVSAPESQKTQQKSAVENVPYTDESMTSKQYIFTYKAEKELRKSGDGNAMEVNREFECSITDPAPLIRLILDLGGNAGITKEKFVECWHYETECGIANIELCTVPPLGDFLEIEIVAEKNDAEFVEKAKKIEEELILRCGIPLNQIEPRYYSEMLLSIKD